MNRILSHDKMEKGIHHPLLALDFENDSTTGKFICAGVAGKIKNVKWLSRHERKRDDTYIEEYFTDINKLHNFLLSLTKGSCLLIFYNLSYDKIYLNDILAKPEIDKKSGKAKSSILEANGRIISLKLLNGLKALDLFNHTMFGSLADWIKYLDMGNKFGIQKQTLDNLQTRVMSDARATYRLGEFIEDFYYNECKIPLRLTIGSAALKLFTTKFFTDYWERDNDELALFERRAYYGGRTEIFKRGRQKYYSYDINSTYLSIMRENLIPDASTFRIRSNDDRYLEELGVDLTKNLAIIECDVEIPDMPIGVLPYHSIDGKLIFPIGRLHGTWTNIELSHALKHQCKIIKIYRYIMYPIAKKYFAEFAGFIWDKRIEYRAKGNTGMDLMIKRIGNSLYGKFGQRNIERVTSKLADYPGDIPDGSRIFEWQGATYIDVSDSDKYIPAKFEFPVVCAFITSYARVKLLEAMLANSDNLIYCDTDSIKLSDKANGIDVGTGLGQWKFEGTHTDDFYRPKFYADKHKGVPGRAKIMADDSTGRTFEFERPVREREAMRRNMPANMWVKMIKKLGYEDDKREWQGSNSTPIRIV